jgi:hypothetical protein
MERVFHLHLEFLFIAINNFALVPSLSNIGTMSVRYQSPQIVPIPIAQPRLPIAVPCGWLSMCAHIPYGVTTMPRGLLPPPQIYP